MNATQKALVAAYHALLRAQTAAEKAESWNLLGLVEANCLESVYEACVEAGVTAEHFEKTDSLHEYFSQDDDDDQDDD